MQEAHLRFVRDQEPADLASALQSGMPSLRKLVEPADWEKVRSRVEKFAEKASQDPQIKPKVMKQMSFQLPGFSHRLIAQEASIKRNAGASKVWLHVQGLRPKKKQGNLMLDAIKEHKTCEDCRSSKSPLLGQSFGHMPVAP